MTTEVNQDLDDLPDDDLPIEDDGMPSLDDISPEERAIIEAAEAAEMEAEGVVAEVAPQPKPAEVVPPVEQDDQDIYDLIASATTELATIDEQREAVLAKMEELAEQLDSGDIGQGKYDVELRKLDIELQKVTEQRGGVEQQLSVAERKQQTEQEKYIAQFSAVVQGFLAQPENQVFKEGTPEYKALDDQVRYLQTTQPNLPPATMLQKARNAVAAIMDLPATTAQPQTKPKRGAVDIPPTLAQIPAAESNAQDEFAYLDKLSGDAYTAALAKLTPDQQQRFLNNA